MAAVYTHRFTVPESAIDLYGHASNIEYLRWMQDAATAHTASCGWTLDRYRESRAIWVVRKHAIEYLRPALCGDSLELLTWIESISDCQSTRRYLLAKAGEQGAVARAETLWVCVDPVSGRPRRVPQEFIEAIGCVADESEALRLAGAFPG